jgi:lipopolysaccharide exporter
MSVSTRVVVEEQPGGAEKGLGDRVRAGAMWAGGSTLVLRFANIAIMAVVARIVAPAELGVFALTLVAYGVLVSVAELGVASAIARSDLDEAAIAPTVVTISVVSSFALAALMFAFAEPIAIALGSVDAAAPLRVMALCVAMIGPFAVPGAQLQRTFRQDLIFRANLLSFVPSSAVLILVALLGDGAIAFAWSRVVGQLVVGVLMMVSVTKLYRPGFDRRVVRMLLGFGLPLAFANLLSQILLNVDYVFVGHLLTIEDVGLYTLAFNISVWSTAVIGSMLNGVVLPAFSRVRGEGGDLHSALGRAVRTVALIAAPIGALSLALASPLIVTVYGAKWEGAAPVLGVLAVYGFISVVCLLLANVVASTGRTVVLLVVQAIALVVLIPVMWAGTTVGGLIGVGMAHIVVILLATFPIYLWAIRRTTGAGFGIVARSLSWPVAAAVVAGSAAWAVAMLVPSAPLKLLVGGLAGGLVYLVATAPLFEQLLPSALARKPVVLAVLRVVDRPARLFLRTAPGRHAQ